MQEAITSFFDAVKTRVKNPLIGSFVLAWVIFNYKPILRLFFDEYNSVTEIFEEYPFNWFTHLICPLSLALLWVGLGPVISYGILCLQSKFVNKEKEKRQLDLIPIEKAEAERAQIGLTRIKLEASRMESDIAELSEKIEIRKVEESKLIDALKDLESAVAELDLTIERKKKEVEGKEKTVGDLDEDLKVLNLKKSDLTKEVDKLRMERQEIRVTIEGAKKDVELLDELVDLNEAISEKSDILDELNKSLNDADEELQRRHEEGEEDYSLAISIGAMALRNKFHEALEKYSPNGELDPMAKDYGIINQARAVDAAGLMNSLELANDYLKNRGMSLDETSVKSYIKERSLNIFPHDITNSVSIAQIYVGNVFPKNNLYLKIWRDLDSSKIKMTAPAKIADINTDNKNN